MSNHIELLNKLRRQLSNKRMSLLVGAGFSKNASPLFCDWEQLLYDLTFFLYKTEIHDSFVALWKDPIKDAEFSDYCWKQVAQRLSNKGYLETVSEYIKKKGYPQSIIAYIEDRTPEIEINKNNTISLKFNGEVSTLSEDALALHKAILKLPWKHVYTTNYDELLDVCTNQDEYQKITDKINVLTQDVDKKNQELVEHKKILEEIELQITLLINQVQGRDEATEPELPRLPSEGENISNDSIDEELIDSFPNASELPIGELKDKYTKARFQFTSTKNTMRALEGELYHKAQIRDNIYSIIYKSADLDKESNRKLIKLHGSLRTKSQKELGIKIKDSNLK